jgi:hypothetical protein
MSAPLFSSIMLSRMGGHDVIRVWNRGALGLTEREDAAGNDQTVWRVPAGPS